MRTETIRMLALLTLLAALGGCGGSTLLAYLGGGLPPGDDDIGGLILAAAPLATAQAGEPVPVVGAEVILTLGPREVGRTQSGPGGYFRFERPGTGQYGLTVKPPAGSGLREAQRRFRHQAGRQTFLTVILERDR